MGRMGLSKSDTNGILLLNMFNSSQINFKISAGTYRIQSPQQLQLWLFDHEGG